MQPIRAVLFDYHQTLVDVSRTEEWIDDAWAQLGRAGSARTHWGDERADEISHHLSHVWTHVARDHDPTDRRDLDPSLPAGLFAQAMADVTDDSEFVETLYERMFDNWVPYDDTIPVLKALRGAGVRTVLLSNIGMDLRPTLEHHGMLPWLDALALSYEVGSKKPDAGIFTHALELAGVPAEEALMVGDSAPHDGAGALVGIRTLLLPRTEGGVHGLDAVLRLVGLPDATPGNTPVGGAGR